MISYDIADKKVKDAIELLYEKRDRDMFVLNYQIQAHTQMVEFSFKKRGLDFKWINVLKDYQLSLQIVEDYSSLELKKEIERLMKDYAKDKNV